MNAFFEKFENERRLQEVARSWVGTPFRANSAIKGPLGGVSCHRLMGAILVECGALPNQVWPDGDPRHSIGSRRDLLTPGVEAVNGIRRVVDGSVLPGDLLGFEIGGCVHHIAMRLSHNEMIQAVRHYGVRVHPTADPTWAKRLRVTWRLHRSIP